MDIKQARIALEAKLVERGMDKVAATKEAERFAQDQQGKDAFYPQRWITWKASIIMETQARRLK